MGGLSGAILKVIVSAPGRALVSWMAARRVQMPFPAAVSQVPSPGVASVEFSAEFTTKVAPETGLTMIAEMKSVVRMSRKATKGLLWRNDMSILLIYSCCELKEYVFKNNYKRIFSRCRENYISLLRLTNFAKME
jgi:hypothetical protein